MDNKQYLIKHPLRRYSDLQLKRMGYSLTGIAKIRGRVLNTNNIHKISNILNCSLQDAELELIRHGTMYDVELAHYKQFVRFKNQIKSKRKQ